jgi:hypothetical protein
MDEPSKTSIWKTAYCCGDGFASERFVAVRIGEGMPGGLIGSDIGAGWA